VIHGRDDSVSCPRVSPIRTLMRAPPSTWNEGGPDGGIRHVLSFTGREPILGPVPSRVCGSFYACDQSLRSRSCRAYRYRKAIRTILGRSTLVRGVDRCGRNDFQRGHPRHAGGGIGGDSLKFDGGCPKGVRPRATTMCASTTMR